MAVVFTLAFKWSAGYFGEANLLSIFTQAGAFLNFSLALFNLIPVPPLDGSKALLAILDEYRFQAAHRWISMQGPNLLLVIVLLDIVLPMGPLTWISATSAWLVGAVMTL